MDERKILPALGTLESALQSLELVDYALTAIPEPGSRAPRGDLGQEQQTLDLVAALANLSALLLQFVTALSGVAGSPLDASRLLELIRIDQHIHRGRDELADLGDGFPFDA